MAYHVRGTRQIEEYIRSVNPTSSPTSPLILCTYLTSIEANTVCDTRGDGSVYVVLTRKCPHSGIANVVL
jgi:hypothetical protein